MSTPEFTPKMVLEKFVEKPLADILIKTFINYSLIDSFVAKYKGGVPPCFGIYASSKKMDGAYSLALEDSFSDDNGLSLKLYKTPLKSLFERSYDNYAVEIRNTDRPRTDGRRGIILVNFRTNPIIPSHFSDWVLAVSRNCSLLAWENYQPALNDD